LKAWTQQPIKCSASALFPNAKGGPLSSDAIQRLVKKYTAMAAALGRTSPAVLGKRSPLEEQDFAHVVRKGERSADGSAWRAD
jgi:hypothetical protein